RGPPFQGERDMINFKNYRTTGKVYRKEVTVDNVKDEVWVKRLPALDLRHYHAEILSSDIEVRAQAGFTALAAAICNEDGTPATTYAELKLLDSRLVKELVRVFQEVNASEADPELGNA